MYDHLGSNVKKQEAHNAEEDEHGDPNEEKPSNLQAQGQHNEEDKNVMTRILWYHNHALVHIVYILDKALHSQF